MTVAQELRRAISNRRLLQVMATHSPLSGRLAEEAGFDGLWASGFELSALYGLPDVSLISMSQHLEMVRAIVGAVRLPVIADLDTGFGNAINLIHAVKEYERAGAAAVVVEDKTFPKVTSLAAGGRQELVQTSEFQGKIAAAVARRRDLVVIARTEALIAGVGVAEALERAAAYEDAGADMILVHSKSESPEEIESFVHGWSGKCGLVLVPTSYPQMTVERARALGKIDMLIYGNHAIRASVEAMQRVFSQIRKDGGSVGVEAAIARVEEVFRLQRMDEVKADEAKFLR